MIFLWHLQLVLLGENLKYKHINAVTVGQVNLLPFGCCIGQIPSWPEQILGVFGQEVSHGIFFIFFMISLKITQDLPSPVIIEVANTNKSIYYTNTFLGKYFYQMEFKRRPAYRVQTGILCLIYNISHHIPKTEKNILNPILSEENETQRDQEINSKSQRR